MGDLASDTAVEWLAPGRYRAQISKDWELWGPNGGYLASIALRAAGAHATLPRPGSLSCHYVNVPSFAEVDLEVTTLRATRRAESLRVSMSQGGRAVLEAIVWALKDGLPGPEYDWIAPTAVPPPSELATMVAEEHHWGAAPYWERIEVRPALLEHELNRSPRESLIRGWHRFLPTETFGDDRWLDACRAVVIVDNSQFPAVVLGVSDLFFLAPSLDLHVGFHEAAPKEPWLLVEARGIAAHAGVIGGHAIVWAPDGRVVASGGQQMLCRTLPGR